MSRTGVMNPGPRTWLGRSWAGRSRALTGSPGLWAMLGWLTLAGCAPAPEDLHVVHGEVLESLPGEWQTCVRVSAGSTLLALARAGLAVADVPPLARTVAGAVRTIKVSLHRGLGRTPAGPALLASADPILSRHGWERVVTVAEGGEMAAVYTRAGATAPRHLPVCVLVLHAEELVLVTAVGDAEAVLRVVGECGSRLRDYHNTWSRPLVSAHPNR